MPEGLPPDRPASQIAISAGSIGKAKDPPKFLHAGTGAQHDPGLVDDRANLVEEILGCASIGAVLVRVRQRCGRNGTLQLVGIDPVARNREVPDTLQDKLRTL